MFARNYKVLLLKKEERETSHWKTENSVVELGCSWHPADGLLGKICEGSEHVQCQLMGFLLIMVQLASNSGQSFISE